MRVYTAITGNYDLLKEQPEDCRLGVEFTAFMDRMQDSPTWQIQEAETSAETSCLNAKAHKILSHKFFPDDEVTLWVDGSIEICPGISLPKIANHYLRDADIAVFCHRRRYCLYQEAAHCIQRRRDVPEIIRRQIFRYTQEFYPVDNGLAECTIILRRNTLKIKDFNEFWWREIRQGSIRDQISFPYVVWKTGIKVNYFPGSVGDGSIFLLKEHLHVIKPLRRK
jgi:hypothetical protein